MPNEPLNILFLPDLAYPLAAISASGPPIATGGGDGVSIAQLPDGAVSGADGNRIYLTRLEAVKLGSGTSQAVNWILECDESNTPALFLPVGPSAEGTRIVWEFPVPRRDSIGIFVTIPAGGGNWAFVANGFII